MSDDEDTFTPDAETVRRIVEWLRERARAWEHTGDITTSGKSIGYYWCTGCTRAIEQGEPWEDA